MSLRPVCRVTIDLFTIIIIVATTPASVSEARGGSSEFNIIVLRVIYFTRVRYKQTVPIASETRTPRRLSVPKLDKLHPMIYSLCTTFKSVSNRLKIRFRITVCVYDVGIAAAVINFNIFGGLFQKRSKISGTIQILMFA